MSEDFGTCPGGHGAEDVEAAASGDAAAADPAAQETAASGDAAGPGGARAPGAAASGRAETAWPMRHAASNMCESFGSASASRPRREVVP